jgi:HAD superfamily hydrolase (TIGR01509 family)
MRIDAVFLDAGGVLLDESDMEAACARVVAGCLAPHVPGYSAERYGEDLAEAVHAHCAQAYRFVFWKRLAPDRALFESAYASFLETWRSRRPPLRIMQGIAEELTQLAESFRVGIAGQYGAELLEVLERERLLSCFFWRFTQDDFGITKPDPRYLLRIAEACGVDPQHCVMVGDRIDKDVVPARTVGMHTIRIRTGVHRDQRARVPEELPDLELSSVKGLADAVRRISAERAPRGSPCSDSGGGS